MTHSRLLARVLAIPNWAALSLAMNGLLFATLLVTWQDRAGRQPSMLPEARAAELTPLQQATQLIPQLGDVHRLEYQQWVGLLQTELEATVAKHPDHLTILLGDSLSLWFPSELLPGRRVWLNQGISGEQTQGLLTRLDLLAEADVEAIFLMVGINDLIWGESDAQVLQNYREILAYLRYHHPDTQVIVQSILPHSAELSTWESRDRLLALPNTRIQTINASLADIADNYGADYLDLYWLFANGEGKLRPDLTTDGLHLNRDGYLVWRSAIALYSQLELQ